MLTIAAAMPAADLPALKLDTPQDLEAFLFPAEENAITDSVRALFRLDKAGVLVTQAAKLGPEYALNVASTIPYSEFRQPYRDLARYLDLFGPCQKAQAEGVEGWWSKYQKPSPDGLCSEAVKLLAANLLWSQVHYCRQLVLGEAEPKLGGPYKPRPWHLDEPPVKTDWLKADAFYSLADAVSRLGFATTIAAHCASAASTMRTDCLEVTSEFSKPAKDRDLSALALGKLLLRRYEELHLRHLEKLL